MHDKCHHAPIEVHMLHSQIAPALLALLALGHIQNNLLVHPARHVIKQPRQQ
jgi:hypothetical protein